MELYVNKNEERLGPFTLTQAKRMVATGGLQPTDLAWYEGLTDWCQLQDIPGFAERHIPEVPGPDLHDRPRLVLLVSLLFFFSFPIWILQLLIEPLFTYGIIPTQARNLTELHTTIGWEYGVAWLSLLLTIAWSIYFYRLNRMALPLYIASLGVSFASTIHSIMYENWLGAVASGGVTVIIATALGWIINFFLLGYTWHLVRKGVLN